MVRRTGPGRTSVGVGQPNHLLYNFDVDSASLKQEHREHLATHVVGVLEGGGSVTVVGLADRTGSELHNLALSDRRARNTVAWLREAVSRSFNVRRAAGLSERPAREAGLADNTEDERFRAVIVSVAAGSQPPPPSRVVPPGVTIVQDVPDVSAEHGTLVEIMHDIEGGAEGIGFGLEAIAILGGGLLFELVAAPLHMAAALLALPIAWLTADELARYNGRCEGVWNAIQDMANAYRDPRLDSRPIPQWPRIPEPVPHISAGESGTSSQRAWNEGEEEGCRRAYRWVKAREHNPAPYTFTYQGRRHTARVTGRETLWILYRWRGQNLARAIRDEFNRRLHRAGRGEWPLIR